MRLSCIDVEEAIWDRARGGGELSQDALLHIERCESCAAALAGAEMSLNALRCVRSYPAAPDCVAQVAERISGQRRVFRPLGWVAIPAAIAILLLVFLVPNKTPPVRQVKAPTPAKSKALVPKPVQPRQARPHKRPWYADYGRLIAKVMPKEPERLAMDIHEEQARFALPEPPMAPIRLGGVGRPLGLDAGVGYSCMAYSPIIGNSTTSHMTTTTLGLYGHFNYFSAPNVAFKPVVYEYDSTYWKNDLQDHAENKTDSKVYACISTAPMAFHGYLAQESAIIGDTVDGGSLVVGDGYRATPAKPKAEVDKYASVGAKMTVSLVKHVIFPGEPITMHITVANEAKVDIRLAESYPEADYTLEIEGPGGEVTPRPERWPPGVWRNIALTLKPGETISCDYQVDKMFDLSAPGQYIIRAKRRDLPLAYVSPRMLTVCDSLPSGAVLSGFYLNARLEKPVFAVGEPVYVDWLRATNITDQPLLLPNNDFLFSVLGPSGPFDVIWKYADGPDSCSGSIIKPGQSGGPGDYWLDSAHFRIPGEYRIIVRQTLRRLDGQGFVEIESAPMTLTAREGPSEETLLSGLILEATLNKPIVVSGDPVSVDIRLTNITSEIIRLDSNEWHTISMEGPEIERCIGVSDFGNERILRPGQANLYTYRFESESMATPGEYRMIVRRSVPRLDGAGQVDLTVGPLHLTVQPKQ